MCFVCTSPVVRLAQGRPSNNLFAAAAQPRTLDLQVTSQAPCSQHGHRGTQCCCQMLSKSGSFTKPYRYVTRHHICMQFSTILVTFLSTDDDETSPTIQDGGRQPEVVKTLYLLQIEI